MSNFSRGVGLFYPEMVLQSTENKRLSDGEGLAVKGSWGRRAEDPFRGLRAGPVRYSPLHFRRMVIRTPVRIVNNLPKHPENTRIRRGCVRRGESESQLVSECLPAVSPEHASREHLRGQVHTAKQFCEARVGAQRIEPRVELNSHESDGMLLQSFLK